MHKFILASQSPRRKQLLQYILDDFEIIVSETIEDITLDLSSEDLVMSLALDKAKEISLKRPEAYVLGFDTLVILDSKPMGKPSTREEAFDMLKRLSNKTHKVVTGCAIVKGNDSDLFYDQAEVTFNHMSSEEINEYLDTGEPFDKAGAYGIQGYGARYIKEIKGDYYAVMGMPVQKLYNRIRRLK